MSILVLQREIIYKNELINNKIVWYGDKTLNNNNRQFYLKSIKYVIIIYNAAKDSLEDVKSLINVYNNLFNNKNIELIIYSIITNITKYIYEVLEYLNNTFTDITFIKNDINDINNYIINNL